MTRRILFTMVAVTSVAVVGFGVALGVAVSHLYHDEAVSKLEREATIASLEVPASYRTSVDPLELPTLTDGTRLAVYDLSGKRLAGDGPAVADSAVRRARAAPVTDANAGGSIVVAVPLSSEESVFAVMRASVPSSIVTDRVHRAWLAMFGLGLGVIALAALIASWQARRLTRPVLALGETAARLGEGDFAARTPRSGLPELDVVASALDSTAMRLGELLQRERAFSADASHQLRTPIAGLRVQLEGALLVPGTDASGAIADALHTIDQIQLTIEELLALGRDISPAREPLDVGTALAEAEQRWHGGLAAVGRPLRVRCDADAPAPAASPAAVRQILDVLIANALEHGAGTVSVVARASGGGLAIEVSDEGQGIDAGTNDVFRRRTDASAGRGIGLALARSLAEAEGGRLLLRAPGPHPTFRLLFPPAPMTNGWTGQLPATTRT
jgi:signal transduction histidine kinase